MRDCLWRFQTQPSSPRGSLCTMQTSQSPFGEKQRTGCMFYGQQLVVWSEERTLYQVYLLPWTGIARAFVSAILATEGIHGGYYNNCAHPSSNRHRPEAGNHVAWGSVYCDWRLQQSHSQNNNSKIFSTHYMQYRFWAHSPQCYSSFQDTHKSLPDPPFGKSDQSPVQAEAETGSTRPQNDPLLVRPIRFYATGLFWSHEVGNVSVCLRWSHRGFIGYHNMFHQEVRRRYAEQNNSDPKSGIFSSKYAQSNKLVFLLTFSTSPSACLLQTTVPTRFKRSNIVSVLKKSMGTCLNDWHPVALTSIVSKCFERLIRDTICSVLSASLDPLQFAHCNIPPLMMSLPSPYTPLSPT